MPGDRRNVDDAAAPARDHASRKGDTGHIGAALIDADDVVPGRHRQIVRPHRHLDDAGAVDENVDRPAFPLDGRSTSLDALFVADIDRIGAAAEFRRDGLRLCHVTVGHHDQIAGASEFAHAGRTDAAGAAGHYTDTSDRIIHRARSLSPRRPSYHSTAKSIRPFRSPMAKNRITMPSTIP